MGCINVHASLLPRWRGAAPIHRAIEAGDSHTGVTLMQMATELDAGNVFFQSTTPIKEEETSGALHERLATIGANMLVDHLPEILSGSANNTAQKEDLVTYARKIVNYECWLKWSNPAAELARKIRAFSPRPLARSMIGDKVIIIHHAKNSPCDYGHSPGTVAEVTKDLIRVQTSDGCLDLLHVQLPGSRPTTVREFLNGFKITPGERFQGPAYA